MNEDQVGVYSMYMSTLGNRPDLFPSSAYPNASTVKKPTEYDIPPEEMTDARFAAMMTEARKYIGYPYVWGGSSPKTSFDCSGYASWVINRSGWNVVRLGAQGLCDICSPVSLADMNRKFKKIDAEYEKNEAKISSLQDRQKELEKQRRELENLDIIGLVRGMGMTADELSVLMKVSRENRTVSDQNKQEESHEEI